MSQQEEVRSTPAPESAKGAPKAPNGAAKNADALLEALANEAVEPPKPRSSLGRALRDVIIVGALLGGGLFLYRNNVTIRDKVQKIAVTASEKMQKDDLKSLREAEAAYQEILTLDADNKIGLSGLAETYFHQWRHGLDTKAKAEEALARAEKEGSETPERYATRAYLDVANGRAADAERAIKAMFDQNAYHSKLAHAYGLALLEQGKLNDANQAVQGALDTDFSASRYALTLAEVALRRGGSRNAGDKAALKSLSKVLTSGMNPEHELALTLSAALRAKNYGNIDRPAKWIQTVEAKSADIGPVAKAQLAWASGELALALGDAKVALEKAEEALALKKDYPPFYELKARALVAQGKTPDAYAAYDEALKVGPSWRSTKWAYAYLKSANKSDDALTMIQDLESTEPSATKGPEYEVFRGEHYLRQEKWADAKAAYTRAAELGDDAEILFGLAQITFDEEKKKGNKADLEKVATEFSAASEARQAFPELQEFMGAISLWNFQVDGAQSSYEEADKQYKRLNRPVPDLIAFYDRVVTAYEKAEGAAKKDGAKKAEEWKTKKKEYLASVAALLQQ
jgi:tetratricopeptide (TPR) repeat protein